MTHAPFLDRARSEREQGRQDSSLIALGAYLVARLVVRLHLASGADEDRESFRWQLESTRKFIRDLSQGAPETAHLTGIVAAAAVNPPEIPSVRISLMAYAYFLEHESRMAEALEVLASVAQCYTGDIPAPESTSLALFVARLNRILARWDTANDAYRAAEEAALDSGDPRGALLSRLGRANVMRGQGNLLRARSEIEEVIAEAASSDLRDVVGRASQDLGAVLSQQGLMLDSLQAQFQALQHTEDESLRCRILGDLGVLLRELGATAAAQQAFAIVLRSRSSFVVRQNAQLELMDLESSLGNRVAFERRRQEIDDSADRMPPSMGIDFQFKLGVGFARFGQMGRARRALGEAQRLAEAHALNEWYFRVDRVLRGLQECPDLKEPASGSAEVWETPAVAEVAAGLERFAGQIAD
jgi:tetratricopeptide (TPR) repeat protein